jgi:hypothetical protein
MKSRETLSRAHNDLNTTNNNAELTELFTSTELSNVHVRIKIFVFEIAFGFFHLFIY